MFNIGSVRSVSSKFHADTCSIDESTLIFEHRRAEEGGGRSTSNDAPENPPHVPLVSGMRVDSSFDNLLQSWNPGKIRSIIVDGQTFEVCMTIDIDNLKSVTNSNEEGGKAVVGCRVWRDAEMSPAHVPLAVGMRLDTAFETGHQGWNPGWHAGEVRSITTPDATDDDHQVVAVRMTFDNPKSATDSSYEGARRSAVVECRVWPDSVKVLHPWQPPPELIAAGFGQRTVKKVLVVDSESKADIKLHITDADNRADVCVFKERNDTAPFKDDRIWHMLSGDPGDDDRADVKVYLTSSTTDGVLADRKVFFVDDADRISGSL